MRLADLVNFAWQMPLYGLVIHAWFDAAAAALRALVASW